MTSILGSWHTRLCENERAAPKRTIKHQDRHRANVVSASLASSPANTRVRGGAPGTQRSVAQQLVARLANTLVCQLPKMDVTGERLLLPLQPFCALACGPV